MAKRRSGRRALADDRPARDARVAGIGASSLETSSIKLPGTPPRLVNRLMSAMLRTPGLRRFVGKGFALISVTGSVSGRSYTTPVQYMTVGARYVVLSQRRRRWWRNIEANPKVTFVVRGEATTAQATIAVPDEARSLLAECLSQRPRVAKFYGVPTEQGSADASSVEELATQVVVIVIDPDQHPHTANGPIAVNAGLASTGKIRGDVDEGYGAVADAFRRNFDEQDEIGAACAVFHDGRKVVDLWGGERDGDTGLPWEADTPIVMYSTTKGIASLAVAHAHSRGLFDYDGPVATYWPEFAWRDKHNITIRQLLSHQAGLPTLDIQLSIADLANLDLVAAAIALQAPAWEPGTRHGYHGITLGWYEGELIRRVDPDHRSLGRYFADEIARPLDVDFHIGVPEDFDLDARATIHGRSTMKMLTHAREMPAGLLLGMMNPRSVTNRAFSNPRELLIDVNYNRPDALAVELPAGNGIGTPRAVAKAYSAAVTGDLDLTDATRRAIVEPATPPAGGIYDLVLRENTSYSLGYLKPSNDFPFGGSTNTAFGTPGNGGSFGFADHDARIGYCYAPNRLGYGLYDKREIVLRHALFHDVLHDRPQHPNQTRPSHSSGRGHGVDGGR